MELMRVVGLRRRAIGRNVSLGRWGLGVWLTWVVACSTASGAELWDGRTTSFKFEDFLLVPVRMTQERSVAVRVLLVGSSRRGGC